MIYTFSKLGTWGALGNQLFQLAGVIGEATKDGHVAQFPQWEYNEYFSVPDWHFQAIPEGAEVKDFYPDYMQDLNHFGQYSDYIRSIFQPSKATAKQVDQMFDGFSDPIVAVHVRRANNLTLPDHHPVPTLEYFEAALDQMPTKLTQLLVFSDDLAWCKQQSIFKDAEFGLGVPDGVNIFDLTGAKPLTTSNAALDLLAMTQCHYHIISNSTFSFWGAWLSNSRKVIYPLPWYGPALAHIDTSVMFPDSWIPLERSI